MIEAPRSNGSHLPSLFLALASGFGMFAGLLAALALAAFELTARGQVTQFGVYAWTSGLVALICLPALIYSAPRAFGRQSPRWEVKIGWRLASIALIVWVLDLAAASYLASQPDNPLGRFLLPPFSILGIGIPVWWLIELGRRGLRTTPLRTWGVASVSAIAAVPLAIFLELIGFGILILVVIAVLIGTSPDLASQLERLSQQITNGNIDPQRITALLEPYLQRPAIVIAGLMILSVLTPLLEEFVKPLALWFIPGQRVTEVEGFTLGLVAGGIFALLESLSSMSALSQNEDLWLVLVLSRAGAALLHITCSGLMGWGLASAWQNGRYLRLAGLYLTTAFIHGTWNLFAQLIALGDLLPENGLVIFLAQAAPFIMAAMAVAMLFLLIRLNRHFAPIQASQPGPAVLGSQPGPLFPAQPPADPALFSYPAPTFSPISTQPEGNRPGEMPAPSDPPPALPPDQPDPPGSN